VNIEGEALIITITSPDYTEGKFEDQVYGDILLERGQGWEMEVSYDFTVEDYCEVSANLRVWFFDLTWYTAATTIRGPMQLQFNATLN